jgi:hypothetical protein
VNQRLDSNYQSPDRSQPLAAHELVGYKRVAMWTARLPYRQKEGRRIRLLLTTTITVLALGGMVGCGETKAEEEAKARTSAQEEQHERQERQQEKQAKESSAPPSSESSEESKPSESSKPSEGEASGGSSGEKDEVGSSSHATDSEFCNEHTCIGSFESEGGTIVECSDGTYSHAGGISGSCSHHGGEAGKE